MSKLNPVLKVKYRKIPSLKFLYEITVDGKIRNVKSKKHIKVKTLNGYAVIGINNKNIKQHTFKLHRLIAEVWVKNIRHPNIPISELVVNHKDFNKLNNHANNLEWVTQLENMRYDWANGRREHIRDISREQLKRLHAQNYFPVTERMREACRENSLIYKKELKNTQEYYQRKENVLISPIGEKRFFKTMTQAAKHIADVLSKNQKTVYAYLQKRQYAYGYKMIFSQMPNDYPERE